MKQPSISATAACLLLAAASWTGLAAAQSSTTTSTTTTTNGNTSATSNTQTAGLPSQLVLSAVIRDFKPKGATGGHDDFESFGGSTTVGLLKASLDADHKPVVDSLRGKLIGTEYTDKNGKNINPALYDASKGDRQGSLSTGGTGNGLTSNAKFDQWYRDVPGVNTSKVVQLTLNRVPNTSKYVFDSATDEPYKTRGGFFPINGELFGNYSTTGKNFHFTTELETTFAYAKGTGQVFTFTGDDDVWVFIDGKMVIDIGGLHSKKEQTIDLDRLAWLVDKQTYTLKVFHAERHTTESNFRIETTINLRSVEPPATSGQYD